MTIRIRVRPFPTPTDIRAKYAETGSVRITASRCGVLMDTVLDALTQPAR